MSLGDTALDEIEQSHLAALVELGVPEIRTVDYKRELPARSDTAEFLADVCSFANAGGGDLIYGIPEEGGIPTDLTGVGTGDADADLLRLEQMILAGITPRIPGLKSRYIPLDNGNHVFVIRVPRSFARPHAIHRSDTPRFVTRNSAGKYTMDVAEIRNAVLASDAVAERMSAFRHARLSDVVSGRTTVDMSARATIVLHVLPLGAFDSPAPSVDLEEAPRSPKGFLPIGTGGNLRHTFDGLLCHGYYGGIPGHQGTPESYALLFRSGTLEAADAMILSPVEDGPIIPSTLFEEALLKATESYLDLLSHLGVEGPVFVTLSLLGVKDYQMAYRSIASSRIRPVDRDDLIIPEVMVHSPRLDREAVERLMRPVLDQVWNACGYAGSPNYREDRWLPH